MILWIEEVSGENWCRKIGSFYSKRLTDGNDHQSGGNPEGRRITGVLTGASHLLPEDGRQEGADQAAGVDGRVEQGEVSSHVILFTKSKNLFSFSPMVS